MVELAAAPDETRERADPEGRLLPPPDDAEAGYARDLVCSAAVIATLRTAHLICAECKVGSVGSDPADRN